MSGMKAFWRSITAWIARHALLVRLAVIVLILSTSLLVGVGMFLGSRQFTLTNAVTGGGSGPELVEGQATPGVDGEPLPPGEQGSPGSIAPDVEPVLTPWDGAGRVTVLLLGLDYRDWESGSDYSRSDTMILLTLDPLTRSAGILSIPRDMWVAIPGFKHGKINTGYYLGDAYKLPGLFTPDVELMDLCLESYGEEDPVNSGQWRIHLQDTPQERRQDLKQIAQCLREIGDGLGYQSAGEEPLLWCDEQNEVIYAWYVIASALISDPISQQLYPPEKSLIALPGGRANLTAYKIQHDPRLRQAIDEGWRLVKFRQIRALVQNPPKTKAAFESLITQDILAFETPQLRLF